MSAIITQQVLTVPFTTDPVARVSAFAVEVIRSVAVAGGGGSGAKVITFVVAS